MGTARTTRERWIDEGMAVLVEGGPESVRVEVLAKRIGVTKGGFYGYFSDRQALFDAMLDRWRAHAVDDILATIERVGGEPREQAVLAGHLSFDEDHLPLDLAVREWARRDSDIAGRLRDVDNQRMDLLRSVFAPHYPDPGELEARCLIAFCVAIGSRLIDADHPGRTRQQVLRTITELTLGPVDTPPR